MGIGMPLELRCETQGPFLVTTGILVFLSIFKESQPLSHFEALNSAFLSSCQRDVRLPVKMRWGTRAFSRFSTEDSDIPSSCKMKDDPTFKSLQGNSALFRVRAYQCPFHLRQQILGSSHMTIAERSLLLRCLWKVGIPLESKPGNQLLSRDDLGYMALFSICCAEIAITLDLGRCSQESLELLKGSQDTT